MGSVVPGVEVRIAGDGEILIRGATVMRGYWRKPEATAERLKPGPLPGERVLHTGDLCKLDADGYLYFVARTDDVIKSRGEKMARGDFSATFELTMARS